MVNPCKEEILRISIRVLHEGGPADTAAVYQPIEQRLEWRIIRKLIFSGIKKAKAWLCIIDILAGKFQFTFVF